MTPTACFLSLFPLYAIFPLALPLSFSAPLCPRIFPILNFYMNFATCQMADTDIFLHASCIIEHKNIL